VTHEYPPHEIDDSVTEARVNALTGFEFTQRQREFLVTVMVHAGCFLERQYCALTGTVAKIDRHAEAVDELDVDAILAFAERILPRASDLWVQASLDYRQRLQQLFFPEGNRRNGTTFQVLGVVRQC
jgi:hypothetical protein